MGFCTFGFGFGFWFWFLGLVFVVRYTCFPLFDIHAPVLVGGEVEDVGMLIGFGHLGNMCRTSSRTRLFAPGMEGWMARWIERSGWWGERTFMEGWGACGESLGG